MIFNINWNLDDLYAKDWWKNMKTFTTNLALKDSLDSRRDSADFTSEVLPKEILAKLKLIEKAFKWLGTCYFLRET